MGSTADTSTAPVLAEFTRGDMVESRHRGAFAVVDVAGRVVASAGDPARPVYARSAIKPLQVLPLLETGAADALAVSDAEIAVACASHAGEPAHVAAVEGWLARAGLGVGNLECGAHAPSHGESAAALIRAGERPRAVHNNCSGKHTAMLATCRHCGERTNGYIAINHPAQQRVLRVLAEMTGCDLSAAPRGIDGCGLPQVGIPLTAFAHAFARLGAPDTLAPGRAAACRRVAGAMVAHPLMLAGSGRFNTQAMEIAGGRVVMKAGAEGVYLAAVPARGIGIALKIEDGAGRAADAAMTALLLRFADLDEQQRAALAAIGHPPVTNVAGRVVGAITPGPVLG